MANPVSYNILNKKYSNFVEYCVDTGMPEPEYFAEIIVNDECVDKTYSEIKILAEARLAWSLIKAGIYYTNDKFVYVQQNVIFSAKLPDMIELVLGHLHSL